jgi:hypothetical protein
MPRGPFKRRGCANLLRRIVRPDSAKRCRFQCFSLYTRYNLTTRDSGRLGVSILSSSSLIDLSRLPTSSPHPTGRSCRSARQSHHLCRSTVCRHHASPSSVVAPHSLFLGRSGLCETGIERSGRSRRVVLFDREHRRQR